MNCLECKVEFEPKQRFCCTKCKNRYSYISGKAETTDKSAQSLNSATTLKGSKVPKSDENAPQVSKKGKMVFNLKKGIYENV